MSPFRGQSLLVMSRSAVSPLFPRRSAPGGDERDRTDDPLLAKQVLSQLSYTPIGMYKVRLRVP